MLLLCSSIITQGKSLKLEVVNVEVILVVLFKLKVLFQWNQFDFLIPTLVSLSVTPNDRGRWSACSDGFFHPKSFSSLLSPNAAQGGLVNFVRAWPHDAPWDYLVVICWFVTWFVRLILTEWCSNTDANGTALCLRQKRTNLSTNTLKPFSTIWIFLVFCRNWAGNMNFTQVK